MEDYPLLGVHSMEDQTRLFHLIQMIRALDVEGFDDDCFDDGDDFDFHQVDEGYAALDGSFTPNANHDEVVSDDQTENTASMGSHFARSSCVRRRLSFSDDTIDHSQRLLSCPVEAVHVCPNSDKNDEPVHGKESTTPVQLEHHRRNDLSCSYQRSDCYNQGVQGFLCGDIYNGENIQTEFTGGISKFNSETRYTPKTFSKHKPCHAKVTRKPFSNKPCGHKSRRGLGSIKICFTDTPNPTPVYEEKITSGYNYGLPLSSPHNLKTKKLGGPRINVCVRKRPLTSAECRRGEADVVTTSNGESVIVHESKETVDLTQYILKHRFYFDQVFGEESSNEEVYQRTAYPLVEHMLRGGKATCFAYGQTGAGKTHTMLGLSSGGPGLYALAAQDIFAHLSTNNMYPSLLVYVSFFEIYCGQLHDLLDHRKRLFAREDGQKVVHISDLKNVRVDSVSSLLQVIAQGTQQRTQGISGVNPLSSRSHALLQIQLRDPNQQIAGRMWFVDLAGSERASDAKNPDKQSRKEGAKINQSLLALKECIRSLDKENSHTPFRQSKLTQVLKDSFVGDFLTCMIANISPGHPATEHTLNTLRYADRVKELKGQGGPDGRRISKAVPSSRQNLSSISDNVGTPKKRKSVKQRKSLPTMPVIELHTDGPHLCSQSRNYRCGEETEARGRKAVTLKHTIPLKSCLVMGDKKCPCEGVDIKEGGNLENEMYKNTDSHYVTKKSTKAVPIFLQKNDEDQKEKEVYEGHVAFAERKSGFHCTEKEHFQKTRVGIEIESVEPGRRVYNSRARSSEVNRKNQKDFNRPDDKEKESHLKWYHQQLQQFVPSTLSAPQRSFFSSTTQSSLSCLQQSSCLSVSPNLYCSLEKNSDTSTSRVDVGVDRSGAQMPYPSGDTNVQKEKISKALPESQPARCNNNTLVLQQQRAPRAVLLNSQGQKELYFPACDRKTPLPPARSNTFTLITKRPPECPVYTLAHNSPDLKDKMSVLPQDESCVDSFSYIMDPVSISIPQMEEQLATASSLQRNSSSISRSLSQSEGGEDSRRVVEKECYSCVDKARKLSEDEDAEFLLSLLELPQAKILQHTRSDSVTATGHTEQQKYMRSNVCGLGFTFASFKDQENNQERQKPPGQGNRTTGLPPKQPTLACTQTFVMSPSVQHFRDSGSPRICNSQEYACYEDKNTSSSTMAQQPESIPGHLTLAPSNRSRNSCFSPNSNSGHEIMNNKQIKPTMQLYTLDNMDHAKWCVMEAHLEQLKEMDTLCQQERMLLNQQHNMTFEEYILKLEEFMKNQARSVYSMRSFLQPYLQPMDSDLTEAQDDPVV